MKINNLLENITPTSNPDQGQGGQAPKFRRSDKVLEDDKIEETTAGAIASVASPVGKVQRRGKGSMLQGIKTSSKFPNSKTVKEAGIGSVTVDMPIRPDGHQQALDFHNNEIDDLAMQAEPEFKAWIESAEEQLVAAEYARKDTHHLAKVLSAQQVKKFGSRTLGQQLGSVVTGYSYASYTREIKAIMDGPVRTAGNIIARRTELENNIEFVKQTWGRMSRDERQQWAASVGMTYQQLEHVVRTGKMPEPQAAQDTQEIEEGWKEDSQAHEEFLQHAREQLSAANPRERMALAVRLSNLEKKHFGDEVGQGFDANTGVSATSNGMSAGIQAILSSVVAGDQPNKLNAAPFGSAPGYNKPGPAVELRPQASLQPNKPLKSIYHLDGTDFMDDEVEPGEQQKAQDILNLYYNADEKTKAELEASLVKNTGLPLEEILERIKEIASGDFSRMNDIAEGNQFPEPRKPLSGQIPSKSEVLGKDGLIYHWRDPRAKQVVQGTNLKTTGKADLGNNPMNLPAGYGDVVQPQGMKEAKKANTKTARKEFGKRPPAKLSDKEQEKKKSESDRLWDMLQAHIAQAEKEKVNEVDPHNYDSDEDYYDAVEADDLNLDQFTGDWTIPDEIAVLTNRLRYAKSQYERDYIKNRIKRYEDIYYGDDDLEEARVGNRMSDISVGSPKIVNYKGKSVGEVGIDHEPSPGNGPYYWKHYLTGKYMVGYDTKQEALADLKYLVMQNEGSELEEGVWGDTAKLVGIPAVAGALAVGAGHLDKQQPHVEVGGQSAKIVRADTTKMPRDAMLLKGKDGKMYHVWMTRGTGSGHTLLASPAEEVKENIGGRHRSDGTAGERSGGFKYPGYKPGMSDRELAKLLDKGAEKRRQAEKQKQQGVAEGSDDNEPFDYEEWKASTVKPRKPRGHKEAEFMIQQQKEINRKRKEQEQGVAKDESQPTKYRATVEYGPTAADAHFVTVTANSTEEAEAKVASWCKKKGVRNPMITINGADRGTMGLNASLEQHADDKMKELGHKFKGVKESSESDRIQALYDKLERMEERLGYDDPRVKAIRDEIRGMKDEYHVVDGNKLDEKSKSQAQFRTMAAVAHNPKFAKKVGISQKVGKEFHSADRGANYKSLPKKVDEAEVSEDKLASDLYKDFQIFKKGADKDISNKAKDKDIGSKPKDKDIISKSAKMTKEDKDPCWKDYKQIGMKNKGGKKVPNCVPKESVEEDWQKTNKQDKTDGMSPKAVKAYRRENPGSKLQTAVTKKPSELKAGSKDAKRRKSFCARMSGNKGPMKDEKGRPTPKAKALSRWNCE
jgi:hypothetical protein